MKKNITAVLVVLAVYMFSCSGGGGGGGSNGGGGARGGSLDTTFGTSGKMTTNIAGNDTAYALAIQADGKIVLAGSAYSATSADDFALARYNADGTLDSAFGTSGKVTTAVVSDQNDYARAVGIQSDGKIVAAGKANSGSGSAFAVVRYNADGTLDTTFGAGGIVTDNIAGYSEAKALAIQADGKILVAGDAVVSGKRCIILARYNTDGTSDTSFGPFWANFDGGSEYADAMALQTDGKIVVAGRSTSSEILVARFNAGGLSDANGASDTSFNNGSGFAVPHSVTTGTNPARAYALDIQPDGKIVAAGYVTFGAIDNFALVRFNGNGSLDSTFGSSGIKTTDMVSSQAWAVKVQADGKIVAAGRSYTGNYHFTLVRYNANGSHDTAFGASGNGIVDTPIASLTDYAFGLAILSNGKLIAAGRAYSGVDEDFAVVRYNP